MSWDRTWQMRRRRLRAADVQPIAAQIAQDYRGVQVDVEEEATDCITCFFSIPTEEGPVTVEISAYEMGSGTYILSLEGDASDNGEHWEEASQLAEDLADALDAQPLTL